ncbi:hypothetical protein Pelo_18742 [Pelomyxa schiedti]|nr:hypothetical protein Pelo_18742 [Pelomyxa schiedti]
MGNTRSQDVASDDEGEGGASEGEEEVDMSFKHLSSFPPDLVDDNPRCKKLLLDANPLESLPECIGKLGKLEDLSATSLISHI